jgi:DHA1 family multidrug resistance protein-like MFS transporter
MTKNGLREPSYAALALTFASLGDAFLYPFLPMNNISVGIPLAFVGVLLSINRFARILFNGVTVRLASSFGLRKVMIAAVSIAIISTMGYAVASGILAWVVLRICWGLSFSALRIGVIGYSLQSTKQGLALGVSRSLQEIGPMLSLLIAPFLISEFDVVTTFLVLSLLSLPALYFAINLDGDQQPPAHPSPFFVRMPTNFNAITLISATLVDGILVVVLGMLFLRHSQNITPLMAMTLAAFYLGFRRACLVVLSPLGGWAADKYGFEKVFNVSIVFVIVGLALLASGWIAAGAAIVFAFYSISAAITAGSLSQGLSYPLSAVSENATWRDIGAAIGTLIGGFLIVSPYVTYVLLFGIFSLVALVILHQWPSLRTSKLSASWK